MSNRLVGEGRCCSTPGCERPATLVTFDDAVAVCPTHTVLRDGETYSLAMKPANLDAPILEVVHAALEVVSTESAYRRVCPVCLHGVLPMRRSAQYALLDADMCTSCGQRVSYTDCEVNGEWLARSIPIAKRRDTLQTKAKSEVGLVFGADNRVMLWHLPAGRTSGSLPDDGALWRFLWDNRQAVLGHAHLHPYYGQAVPSGTDLTTYAAIESGLGRRFLWYVVTYDSVGLVVHTPHGYRTFNLADWPSWVGDLRHGGTPDV